MKASTAVVIFVIILITMLFYSILDTVTFIILFTAIAFISAVIYVIVKTFKCQ